MRRPAIYEFAEEKGVLDELEHYLSADGWYESPSEYYWNREEKEAAHYTDTEHTHEDFYGWKIKQIQHIGGEGEGEYAHVVYEITSPEGLTELAHVEGYYMSYDGFTFHFHNFHLAEAYEYTETRYRDA